MRLTTRTRYATRAMVDLANQPKGKPISLTEIAKRQDVTVKYLGKIFLQLLRAELIRSKKGPGGGYYIGRNPRSIKLSEIMEAVGESRAPVFCVAKKRSKDCPRMNRCPTRPYWGKLKEVIDTFFDKVTLYDISKMKKHEWSV